MDPVESYIWIVVLSVCAGFLLWYAWHSHRYTRWAKRLQQIDQEWAQLQHERRTQYDPKVARFSSLPRPEQVALQTEFTDWMKRCDELLARRGAHIDRL